MSPPVWSMAPTAPASTAAWGSMPNRVTRPASGGSRPSIMSIVVVLPAPFGPRRATVSPGAMRRSTPRTARTGPPGPRKLLASPSIAIPACGGASAGVVIVVVVMTTGSRDGRGGGRAAAA